MAVTVAVAAAVNALNLSAVSQSVQRAIFSPLVRVE